MLAIPRLALCVALCLWPEPLLAEQQEPVLSIASAWGDGLNLQGETQAFPVGSLSKTITAILAIQAAERGELSLDSSLAELLPEYAAKIPEAKFISLRSLLSHRAGLFNYSDLPEYQAARDYTLEAALSSALKQKPYFAPGQGWHYSNTHYLLVQKVLEKASGMPFSSLFRTRIAQPLGLRSSGYRYQDFTLPTGRHGDERQPPWNDGLADSGLISTPRDLQILLKALFQDETLLSATRRREMTRFVSLDPRRGAYGLGLARASYRGLRYWWHSGFLRGYLSAMYWFPDSGKALVVLVNRSDEQGQELMRRMFEQAVCRQQPGLCP